VIGSLFAGHLGRVAEVSVLTRREEQAAALNEHGLRVSGRSDFVAPVQAPLPPPTSRFADRFAPSQADIAIIKRYLDGFGITTDEVFADRLLIKATGTADAFERAFTVEMRDVSRRGKRFHRPRHAPRIPLLLRDLLVAIQGLSNEPQFVPKHHSMAELTPLAVPQAVVPAGGATQWLPIFVGDRRAREILLLCDEIPAKQAEDWGLVNRAVPAGELDAAVDYYVERLAVKLPQTIRYTKQQLNWWRDISWHETVGHARDWLALSMLGDEAKGAIRDFLKR